MKIFTLWAVTITLVVFCAWNELQVKASAHPGEMVYSHVSHDNRPIRRCMNMSAMEAENEGDWGYKIRKSDLMKVANAGFDTIRLPVNFSYHTEMKSPYRIDPKLLNRTDQIINWSLELGLQVIVDVHNYWEINENPDYHEPRLEAIWDQLATRYASAPPGLMFELLNEPYEAMTVERTDKLNHRLVERIRRDNPNRWIIVGSAEWGNLYGLLKSNPPIDPKIITTFHYYEPFEYTHQGASWTDPPLPMGKKWGSFEDKQQIRQHFRDVRRWQVQNGEMPLLLGEFGVLNTLPDHERAVWTDFVRETAEQEGFGWCYWGWALGFGAYDLDRERWIEPIRQVLQN